MAAAEDYQGQVTFTDERGPLVASLGAASVGSVRNLHSSEEIFFPDTGLSCRVLHFIGRTTPDNTDYPDSVAPIGSTFLRLTEVAQAVTAAVLYRKVSAATWQAVTTS